MAKNSNLGAAKAAKNDEFYTQYADIQKEVNAYLEYNPDTFRDKTVLLPCDDPEWSNFTRFFAQNFERLGLKRLISTSYAVESKKYKDYEPTLFETESPLFDIDKTRIKGKIFELTRDTNGSGRIDIDDLEWHYLEGDGDFRSPEVCALRDQADIIVTNPPFSLFREFVAWIIAAEKRFLVIGNKNAITYKEIFPLIRDNKLWMGPSITSGDREFMVPRDYATHSPSLRIDEKGNKFIRVPGVHWFTNLEHGLRHEPLRLMSMKDNIRYGRHKEIRDNGYIHYANYDAIDVPFSDAIPDDYDGMMGVPITFLDKYCPEQFVIIGQTQGDSGKELGLKPFDRELKKLNKSLRDGQLYYMIDGKPEKPYARILIRKKQ
ncbi:MAG: adenine-specific methyltransferase EcoRI family protein [Bacteroidales bacterium]|nr:adenine-specific methyltransferase EcoRI family protein [Bacteroidales bacterium]